MEHEKRGSARNDSTQKENDENYERLKNQFEELLKEKESLEQENKRLKELNRNHIEMADKLQNQHIQTQNQLRTIIMLMAESNPIRESLDVPKVIEALAKQIGEEYGGNLSTGSHFDWSNSKISEASGTNKEGSSFIPRINRGFSSGFSSHLSITGKGNESGGINLSQKQSKSKGKTQNSEQNQVGEVERANKLLVDLARSKNGKMDENVLQAVLKRVNGFERKRASGSSTPSRSLKRASSRKKEEKGNEEGQGDSNKVERSQEEEDNVKNPKSKSPIKSDFKKKVQRAGSREKAKGHASTPLKLE